MNLPTRDQELWALALHIERKHGAEAQRVIAEIIGMHVLAGEGEAVEMWREVARRYVQLTSDAGDRAS